MVSDRPSSNAYTVLARRFRPKSFDEVVGQEHVGQALQNAIRAGRVAHAYLFTGARGVGKTSSARIFAKALNCPNVRDGVPCNNCEVCDAIGAGSDVDVLEIDGASNRGIDDIRQLRANVGIRSMRSPFKVYIIDEVHMLTKEAFNALLKTLEEPPPNVKFVFCTTEPNKVPDTILSRCQRFDFGTIDQESIAGRLRQIAEAEGKTVEEDAIELVARRANGSMRDSQSLFDQLLAFGGELITAKDVHQLLGTASDDRLFSLVDACIAGEPGQALVIVEEALMQGVQTGGLADQLINYLRDLLVSAAGAKSVALSAVTDNHRPKVLAQAEQWGLQTVSAAMQIMAETKNRMQRTTHSRAMLELAVVRMATLEKLDQLSVLLQVGGQLPSLQLGSAPAPVARAAVISGGHEPAENADALKKNDIVKPHSGEEEKVAIVASATVVESQVAVVSDSPPQIVVAQQTTTTVQVESVSQADGEPELTEEFFREHWQKIMDEVPYVHASKLKNSHRLAILGPNLVELHFPTSYTFAKQYCERADSMSRLVAAATGILGRRVEFRLQVDLSAEVPVKVPENTERPVQIERLKPVLVENDRFVQHAVNIFGGQVMEVRPILDQPAAVSESENTDEPQNLQEDN